MDLLVSGLEMAELDRRTISEMAVPGRVLMETAGRAVAEYAARLLAERREGDRPAQVEVACGTGNNGGDGFVAAAALAARGHVVRAWICGERARIQGDARAALTTAEKRGDVTLVEATDARAIWELSEALSRCDLVIDALLGTGMRNDVRGAVGDAIDVINRHAVHVPVVSVDLPSGVDADTGAILGRAVLADATVTFGLPKRGHYLFPGAEMRGALHVADIGIPRTLAEAAGVVGTVVHPQDGPRLVPVRRGGVHKGSFGHVVVVAGSPATPGAALLALGGALRAGAGLVSWATDEATLERAPTRFPEVMLRVRTTKDLDAWAQSVLAGASAVVMGPGMSMSPERGAEMAAILARAQVPVCLDADALNLLAQDPRLWSHTRAPMVITPHPKEMARLTQSTVAAVQRDRFAAALQLALLRSCVVVLKGAGTVIADPGGRAAVIAAGGPSMSTGGTGDVLAGVIGAFLAQGLDLTAAARAGTLLHACAGDAAAEKYGTAGVRASDVIDALGIVLRRWNR